MISLLDVNVLIALMDGNHAHHRAALSFFRQAMIDGWATCPLTENGFLRIFGHPDYPGGPGSPEGARKLLTAYLQAPGHQFWTDDLSLADLRIFTALPTSKHLTDLYLLALAAKKGGRFATFDQGVAHLASSLAGAGKGAWYQIPQT